MRKENLSKLAEDISNPSSLKDMWNKIKNLKLYKQIKPSNSAISDSEHRDFLNQIATAPNTAMCPDVSFSPDLLIFRVNFLTS